MNDSFMRSLRGGSNTTNNVGANAGTAPGSPTGVGRKRKVRFAESEDDNSVVQAASSRGASSTAEGNNSNQSFCDVESMGQLRRVQQQPSQQHAPLGNISNTSKVAADQTARKRAPGVGIGGGAVRVRTPSKGKRRKHEDPQQQLGAYHGTMLPPAAVGTQIQPSFSNSAMGASDSYMMAEQPLQPDVARFVPGAGWSTPVRGKSAGRGWCTPGVGRARVSDEGVDDNTSLCQETSQRDESILHQSSDYSSSHLVATGTAFQPPPATPRNQHLSTSMPTVNGAEVTLGNTHTVMEDRNTQEQQQLLKVTLQKILEQRRLLNGMIESLQGFPEEQSPVLARTGTSTSTCNTEVGAEVHSACTCGGGVVATKSTADPSALRERVEELQSMVLLLQEEKMGLSMALAPLQGQLEIREAEWAAEKEALTNRASAASTALTDAQNRRQSLENSKRELTEERSSLEKELRKLRREADEKETKTAEEFWQKTVAATRENSRLVEELSALKETNERLLSERGQLDHDLKSAREQATALQAQLAEAEKAAARAQKMENVARDSEAKLSVLMAEFSATSAALSAVRTELAEEREESSSRAARANETARIARSNLEAEVQRLRTAICSSSMNMNQGASASGEVLPDGVGTGGTGGNTLAAEAEKIRHEETLALVDEVRTWKARAAELEGMVTAGEAKRRRMHNTIQELRGNIRVFVRARPFLPSDGESPPQAGQRAPVHCGSDCTTVAVIPSTSISTSTTGGEGMGASQAPPVGFVFDHVFPPSAGQEEVFSEVSSFVESALDGYKVCLFSYGQTGSGKTHSMQGSGRGLMRGIIPRAVEQILTRAKGDVAWSYELSASFLEIYNEQLRDLLDPSSQGGGGKSHSAWDNNEHNAANNAQQKLTIRKSAMGGMEVAGQKRCPIDCQADGRGLEQLEDLFNQARRARSVARTGMNEQSSRSHSVFTLFVKGTERASKAIVHGTLHLVDLAGSERLDRSGALEDKKLLKETQSINKSLSCLADVFTALAQKSPHTPFRNSKLTFLLQDCLSGDGKALMLVNVSPTAASVQETICSLRFASQVNQVELGKATRQITLARSGTSNANAGHPSSSSGTHHPKK